MELAYKLNHESVEPNASSGRLVKVWRYWLDQTTSDLNSGGLINVTHGWSGGPHATLTVAGRQALKRIGIDAGVVLFNEVYNARLRAGIDPARARQDEFVTPWLNEPAPGLDSHVPAAAAVQPPEREDDDEAARAEAAEILDQVSERICDADSFSELAGMAGIALPLTIGKGEAAGAIHDAKGAEILTIDVNREEPDDLVLAQALLVMFAINDMVADDELVEPVNTEPQPEPAVPIRRSITPDFIVCLEDGRKFRSLKRHLRTRYNLSPDEYRTRWGLPRDYPMVAPNYAAARYALARSIVGRG